MTIARTAPATSGGDTRGDDGYLGDEAAALLNSDDLQAIERHISTVTGSGEAIIICVVFPPV